MRRSERNGFCNFYETRLSVNAVNETNNFKINAELEIRKYVIKRRPLLGLSIGDRTSFRDTTN